MILNCRSSAVLGKLQRIVHPSLTVRRGTKTSSTRPAEAVFVEKVLEVPVITVTEKENVDMIGPPDPVSNLRPVVRRELRHETELQRRLRLMQDETHSWNQKFWAKHNTKFVEQRKAYVKGKQMEIGEDRALTADEMSTFYKRFLDDNWSTHVRYNMQWYKRNFTLLFLALRASLPRELHFTTENH